MVWDSFMQEQTQTQKQDCPIYTAALRHADRLALDGADALPYADFARHVSGVAWFLHGRGVRRGDHVLMLAPASPMYCVALWALFRLGAVACPMNPAWPDRRIRETMTLLDARLLIAESQGDFGAHIVVTLAQLAAAPRDASATAETAIIDGLAPATIVMTAGSSGMPKAAVLCLNNHLHSAERASINVPLSPGDRWLLSLPLYHVSGLAVLFRCALAGATVVVAPTDMALDRAVTQFEITHVSLVPTQLRRLLSSPSGRAVLGRMKGVLLGGAPLDTALSMEAAGAGVPLICSYGMTETAAQLCATRPGADLEELQSDGRPLTQGSLRIGEDGMIDVRGNMVFLGYCEPDGGYRRPETSDGWFRTGDLGYFDDQGLLHVSGRADAMFISGGENIHPEEIEAALCALPGITRAVVAPVPHDDYGAVPCAFLECPEDALPSLDLLREQLRAALPGYKHPHYCFPLPEASKARVKPDRKWLQEHALWLLAMTEGL